MPAILIGLLSAICASLLAALSGHGVAMVFLAYVLGGTAGLLLAAWRQVIASDCNEARDNKVNKPFIVEKDKSVGPL